MGRSWARQALRTRGFVAPIVPIVPVVGYSAPLAFTYSQSVSVSGASTSGLGGMGLAVLGGLMLHALRKQDGPAVQADVAHRLDF
jgi:MYXO-CTERM domain-containing protein